MGVFEVLVVRIRIGWTNDTIKTTNGTRTSDSIFASSIEGIKLMLCLVGVIRWEEE